MWHVDGLHVTRGPRETNFEVISTTRGVKIKRGQLETDKGRFGNNYRTSERASVHDHWIWGSANTCLLKYMHNSFLYFSSLLCPLLPRYQRDSSTHESTLWIWIPCWMWFIENALFSNMPQFCHQLAKGNSTTCLLRWWSRGKENSLHFVHCSCWLILHYYWKSISFS